MLPFSADDPAKAFVARHEAEVRPLEKASNLAWWVANVSGKDADFGAKEQAQNRLDAALADRDRFDQLKKIKEGSVSDSLLARQVDVLYLLYQEKQVDPALLKKITAKANAIEQAFNVYRAKVVGKELADSEVRKILKESKNSTERKEVWEASKGVGPLVEADLKELVKLRNQVAKDLGFPSYHALQLHLNEQSQTAVIALFDELDALTRAPFLKAKAEIDARLAKSYGIARGPQALARSRPVFPGVLDGHDAPRAGALGLFQPQHAPERALRPPHRGPYPHNRRHRDAV